MYWSAEETLLAVTGALFGGIVALSFHPRTVMSAASRWWFGAVAVAFVVAALVLAPLETVVYPPLMWAVPTVPTVILAFMFRDIVKPQRLGPAADAASRPEPAAYFMGIELDGDFVPDGDFPIRRVAADPSTPPAELAEIAYTHPELRAVVAGNLATPASVLEWLASLGDPRVHSAMRARH